MHKKRIVKRPTFTTSLLKGFILFIFSITFLTFPVLAQNPGQNSAINAAILTPGQLNRSQIGNIITVQGSVREFQPAWNDRVPHSIFLQDATGSIIRAVYWDDVSQMLGNERIPKPGQLLRITGQLNEFQGNLQLLISNASDITDVTALKQQDSTEIALSAIDKSLLTKYVVIRGKVEDIRPSWKPRAPDILTLTDGIGSIKLVYWDDIKQRIPVEHQPEIGKNLVVKAYVDIFRDEIQLKLDNPFNIQAVNPGQQEVEFNNPSLHQQSAGNYQASTSQQYQKSQPQIMNTGQPSRQTSQNLTNPFTGASGAGSSQPVNNASGATPPSREMQTPQANQQSSMQGFYPMQNARSLIQGPPPRPHVLLFMSDVVPNSSDGRIMPEDSDLISVTEKAVFVWIDVKESQNLAQQLKVNEIPTWIFYTASGQEMARSNKALTPGELRQFLQKIK